MKTSFGLAACMTLAARVRADDPAAVPGPDPKAVVGGTLVEASAEPRTFNLLTSTDSSTTRICMREVLEPLFSISEQDVNRLAPRLAVSWESLPDQACLSAPPRRAAHLFVHGRVSALIRHLGARSTDWWIDPAVPSPGDDRGHF